MESSFELESEYELIDFWRIHLPQGESVTVPRLIIGKSSDYIFGLSDEAVLFDAVCISREHLDLMTNQEVIEFINSQAHTIH